MVKQILFYLFVHIYTNNAKTYSMFSSTKENVNITRVHKEAYDHNKNNKK